MHNKLQKSQICFLVIIFIAIMLMVSFVLGHQKMRTELERNTQARDIQTLDDFFQDFKNTAKEDRIDLKFQDDIVCVKIDFRMPDSSIIRYTFDEYSGIQKSTIQKENITYPISDFKTIRSWCGNFILNWKNGTNGPCVYLTDLPNGKKRFWLQVGFYHLSIQKNYIELCFDYFNASKTYSFDF